MGIIDTSVAKINIDGINFSVKKGLKVIEVADAVGIYIPRFCYHKKLSIAANCRMCLVEIEKAPKLLPACATPVMDGMKILTNTTKVINAQRSVMEFLLINHPLDCPICDQGGECELQDLAIGYGCSSSRFIEKKRAFEDYDLGSLISTDVTRCILCSRCVRFCSEIAGVEELGIINRGDSSRIFVFLKKHLSFEVSGNIIDLCPVGALTAKPSKFKYRPWELTQKPSISCHDSIGSNIYVHVFRDKVIRIVPKKNDSLNESWISDRDRFSYEGLYSDDRIKHPMIKKNDKWIKISWNEAIDYTISKLLDIKNKFGANNVGCLASPNSTLEELYILQKLLRCFGSNNLDHRFRQLDFKLENQFPIFPGLDLNLNDIDKIDTVFIIGSDIIKEQPIIGLKLRKIINNGGKIIVLNPIDFTFSMPLNEKIIVNPKDFLEILLSIVKLCSDQIKNNFNFNNIFTSLNNLNNLNKYKKISDHLISSKNSLILLGSFVVSSPDYSKIVSICTFLSKLIKSNLGIINDGCNFAGAWLTGFIPHRLPGGKNILNTNGLNAFDMFSKKLKSYILFGLEVEFDSLYSNHIINSLMQADFVLSFTSFKSKQLLETANIILPISLSYENSGTFINMSGILQTFSSAVSFDYNIKNGWEVINLLAKKFNYSGFYYNNVEDILKEIKIECGFKNKLDWQIITSSNFTSEIDANLTFIPIISNYTNDPLVRRAKALQKIDIKHKNIIKINLTTYKKMELNNNLIFLLYDKQKIKYNVFIDENMSNNSITLNSNNVLDNRAFLFPYKSISFEKV